MPASVLPTSTTLSAPPAGLTGGQLLASGQEVARFVWGRMFLALDARPDGALLFAAGDESQRISDWLDHARIAPWVMVVSRLLRLRVDVARGDEVAFRSPQLRAQEDATIDVSRRFTADASVLRLRIASASTGIELSADLSPPEAQTFLGALGAAVGEAFRMARGAR